MSAQTECLCYAPHGGAAEPRGKMRLAAHPYEDCRKYTSSENWADSITLSGKLTTSLEPMNAAANAADIDGMRMLWKSTMATRSTSYPFERACREGRGKAWRRHCRRDEP
jgi:hypothetical protein